MKNPKTMSMPKAIKTLVALTPREQRIGRGDLPKTEEGLMQPGTPGIMAIFQSAVEAETRAKLQSRKGKEKDSKDSKPEK